MQLIEAKTEERPVYFDFTKSEIMGRHPTMANLDYDPFPNAKPSDVVRRVIIGRELVLHAKVKAASDAIQPHAALNYNGRKFGAKSIETAIDMEEDENSIHTIEATCPLTRLAPLEELEKLRATLAAAKPD